VRKVKAITRSEIIYVINETELSVSTNLISIAQYQEYEYIDIEHLNTLWWYMYEWDVLLVV